ncbi:MAG: hypothetical protein E7224_01695 [Clostridiales bacterium]|nr:hypothetical protein [Clostridiales bacterium]
MVTALYAFGYVYGAGGWFLYCLICALLYIAICCISKRNRSAEGLQRVFFGLLGAEVVVDLFWGVLFFPGGEYVNHGMTSLFALAWWIPLLLIAGIVVTILNRKVERR